MDVGAGPSIKRFKYDKDVTKTVHITEIKRNGSSEYVSLGGVNVSNLYQSF